jgi:hypothetical protein
MSTLKVDSILDTSGNDTVAGKILQVQNITNTTLSSQSISLSTVTDINDMSVSITPSSTSSKILLAVYWVGECYAFSIAYNSVFSLTRNGTYLGQSGSSRNEGIASPAISHPSDSDSTLESCSFVYLDSPSTTSAITYNLVMVSGTAGTLFTNRTRTDTNSSGYERGVSSMIAMEIAG